MAKKFSVPVYIETTASHYIGEVECDNIDEYQEAANKLWEEQDWDSPTTNIHNDFDLNDWDIGQVNEDDLKYYKNEE